MDGPTDGGRLPVCFEAGFPSFWPVICPPVGPVASKLTLEHRNPPKPAGLVKFPWRLSRTLLKRIQSGLIREETVPFFLHDPGSFAV